MSRITRRGALSGGGGNFPNYYVDSVAGNDSGDGLSSGSAFATLAKVVSVAGANKRIGLKRGSTFRETLTMPAASGIKVYPYGSGNKPIITGSNSVTGHVAESGGTEGTGELSSVNFDAGNLTGVTAVTTGGTVVASTDFARSASYSAKITGNGTDNRVHIYRDVGTTNGSGSRRYFFAMYTATGSLKNSSELRCVRLQSGATAQIYLSIFTNSSGVPTTFTLNDTSGGAKFTLTTQSMTGWSMGAWNIVELDLTATVSGSMRFWLNGVLQGTTPTVDLSGVNYTGINRLLIGNDAFGTGIVASQSIYVDDIKVSASAISAALRGGDANRWSVTLTTQPTQLFVDGARGERVATAGAVTSYRQWHWASNTLTVYGPANATSPTLESSIRSYCIDGSLSASAVFEDLDLRNSALTGLHTLSAVSPTARRIAITGSFVEGIRAAGQTAHNNGIIEDCIISECGGSGISLDGTMSGWRVRRNMITGCGRLNDEQVGAHLRQQFSAGIKYWGWGVDGYSGDFIIESNIISNCTPAFSPGTAPQLRGYGIWLDEAQNPTSAIIVRYNRVFGCPTSGIFSEKSDTVQITNNLTYNNATVSFRANIHVEANSAGYDPVNDVSGTYPRNTDNVLVEHNTCYGGYWGIEAQSVTASCLINSCIFRNNIVAFTTAGQSLYTAGGGSNDTTHGSGNTYPKNCFGAEASAFIVWGGSVYGTYAAANTASGGAISASVSGNPLFNNAASFDFSLQSGSPCKLAGSDGLDLGANLTLVAPISY